MLDYISTQPTASVLTREIFEAGLKRFAEPRKPREQVLPRAWGAELAADMVTAFPSVQWIAHPEFLPEVEAELERRSECR